MTTSEHGGKSAAPPNFLDFLADGASAASMDRSEETLVPRSEGYKGRNYPWIASRSGLTPTMFITRVRL